MTRPLSNFMHHLIDCRDSGGRVLEPASASGDFSSFFFAKSMLSWPFCNNDGDIDDSDNNIVDDDDDDDYADDDH